MANATPVEPQDIAAARSNIARLIFDVTNKGINPEKITVEIMPDAIARTIIPGSKGVNVHVHAPKEYTFSLDELEALESSLTFDSPVQGMNARLRTDAVVQGVLDITITDMLQGAEAIIRQLASGHIQPKRSKDSAHLTPPRPR